MLSNCIFKSAIIVLLWILQENSKDTLYCCCKQSTCTLVILLLTHGSITRFLIPSLHNLGFPSFHPGIIFTLKKIKTKKNMQALKSTTQNNSGVACFPCHTCIKSWWLFFKLLFAWFISCTWNFLHKINFLHQFSKCLICLHITFHKEHQKKTEWTPRIMHRRGGKKSQCRSSKNVRQNQT